MSVQVAAHGFDLTDGLRDCCHGEIREKLTQLAHHNDFKAKWILSLERGEHVAHLNWSDGKFHGDVTVKSDDMYNSIHQSVRKAAEQLKRAHGKAYDRQALRTLKDGLPDEPDEDKSSPE